MISQVIPIGGVSLEGKVPIQEGKQL